MSAITIFRGTFSGGKQSTGCLAGHAGYRCIHRDMIVEKAAAYEPPGALKSQIPLLPWRECVLGACIRPVY